MLTTDTDKDKNKTNKDFKSIGLYPGATMQIHAVSDSLATHHWVKLIGFIENDCILTSLPFKYGSGMWIHKGEDFVVRGFNGRYAYAFTSQVIGECTSPFLYLYFSWPQSIESLAVRSSLRVGVSLPVNISLADNSSVTTKLQDLSIYGAMIDSAVALGAVGDQIQTELMVNIDGNVVKVSISATIRNIHHKEDGQGFNTGLEFMQVSQNDLLALSYCIDCATRDGSTLTNFIQ